MKLTTYFQQSKIGKALSVKTPSVIQNAGRRRRARGCNPLKIKILICGVTHFGGFCEVTNKEF